MVSDSMVLVLRANLNEYNTPMVLALIKSVYSMNLLVKLNQLLRRSCRSQPAECLHWMLRGYGRTVHPSCWHKRRTDDNQHWQIAGSSCTGYSDYAAEQVGWWYR